MNLIAAVDSNWGIGLKGQLLVSIPEDKKFFRQLTVGKVVVMGRRTLAEFPNGLPLSDRTNIILSHNKDFKVRGASVVHSIEELRRELSGYPSEDIYVIGGGMVYEQLLDWCDVAYITKMDYAFEADTYFPNLDEKPEWELVADSEEQTYFDLEYYFYRYEKKDKKAVQK
ncbi:MAG: dihydrofolate reductase [Roseburia sp.]